MDSQDIRTLKILEEIDRDQTASQRTLARKLNVSLGLINLFIKRLANKGHFKITNIPRNRVKYILTPQGAAEKTRLTYEYIKYSFGFYKSAREKLRNRLSDLESQGVRKVVFYGAGDLAEIAYISLQEFDIELAAVVDRKMKGNIFFGMTIADPSQLEEFEFDRVLLTKLGRSDDYPAEFEKAGIDRLHIVEL